MDTKQQHATKKPMGQWGNQEGNLKSTSRQMIMKTQPCQVYGMTQKQCSEGNS